jgi:hypothetical protein
MQKRQQILGACEEYNHASHLDCAKYPVDTLQGFRQNSANVGGLDANPSKPLPPPPTDSSGLAESESNQMPTDSLHALSKRDLIALLRRKPCLFDDADLYRLTQATIQRLRVLQRRAREGKSVYEASEFAHWLTASGLLKLLRGVDKVEVEKLAQGTLGDCEDTWRTEGRKPWVELSVVEVVNAKLDFLLRRVASVEGNNPDQATVDAAPGLRLLPDRDGAPPSPASASEASAAAGGA